MLKSIHEIETDLGRIRKKKAEYQSRTIDIDILFYDDEIIDRTDLTIPHPRLHLRRFTLKPLAEIAPDFIHPVFGRSIKELLASCDDDSDVQQKADF
jgi:2-amino-4-hydroxy-6-hydroxymethyldihydropteridine diphosphokinase